MSHADLDPKLVSVINDLYVFSIKETLNRTSFEDVEFGSPVYGEVLQEGSNNIFDALILNGLMSENTVFYDLGSGLGKLVIHMSIQFPHIKKIVGIEYSKERYTKSKELCLQSGQPLKNLELLNSDFATVDIADATIIYVDDTCHKCYDLFSLIKKKGYLPKKFTLISPTSSRIFSKKCKDKMIKVAKNIQVVPVDQTYISQRRFYIYDVHCR